MISYFSRGKFGEIGEFFTDSFPKISSEIKTVERPAEDCPSTAFNTEWEKAYAKAKTEIGIFLNFQLNSIGNKWSELTSQPIFQ